MANLYELTSDLLKLQELLEEGELDAEALADAMSYTKEEFSSKMEGYCKVIRNIENSISGLKAEEERMASRRKAMENNIKAMKSRMLDAMVTTDTKKVEGELFTISRAKTAPSVKFDIPDDQITKLLSARWLVPVEPKVDKKLIKADLEGDDEVLKFALEGICHLESGESLRVK